MTKIISKAVSFLIPSKVGNIFKNAQNFLRGKKTYLAGAIILLEGVLMLLDQFSTLGSTAELLVWLKNILSNDGFIRMAEALAIFGFRAALSKKA